ncbi:MAG: amidohydrolase family protein [Chloroflexi bacterium]|nr:amidohydrolase family protein [Chloroflexota bacterium]
MVSTEKSSSQAIRARLGHPIIDSDGHTLEVTPTFLEYVKQIGGRKLADRFAKQFETSVIARSAWLQMSADERRDMWTSAGPWWAAPTINTLDRATAMLPRLLNQRMDELGIDFTVIYPSWRPGLMRFADEQDEEIRRVASRALNTYLMDVYGPCSDRMTPAAFIPMHTPEEAIEELEYAVDVLGMKVAVIAGLVRRPIPRLQREYPGLATAFHRIDTLGIDSDYDYDPFWQRCIDLKIAPAAHASRFEWEGQGSISNYVYNHIGAFATAGEALCKSLFMGGVTKRFPSLRVAFLEGGVAWACTLYANMIGHWEKRNGKAIRDLNPSNLDQDLLFQLIDQYGDKITRSKLEDVRKVFATPEPAPEELDDWIRCPMERAEEIKDLFVEPFYFGCEADDPTNAWAFNTKINPFGARLKVIFGSDIGHWDVPDMREVVAEAYELVEGGTMTEEDFRDFTFTNAVTFYGNMNPNFFKGTRVEAEAAKVLESQGRE